MWVRGLKPVDSFVLSFYPLSHPMWVRGLKQQSHSNPVRVQPSHPMWVRGLKQTENKLLRLLVRRTLCGCVD